MNDYESVKRFDELVIEYHAYVVRRPIAELLSVLGRDFDCVFINEEFYDKYSKQPREMQGMIKCVKKDTNNPSELATTKRHTAHHTDHQYTNHTPFSDEHHDNA